MKPERDYSRQGPDFLYQLFLSAGMEPEVARQSIIALRKSRYPEEVSEEWQPDPNFVVLYEECTT
jgi:hypothetical protein